MLNDSKKCPCMKIAFILLFVGGLNWGLYGLGMLFGFNLNIVNLLLGSLPTVEAIVYVLVGISAVVSVAGCMCKKCKEGKCCEGGECKVEDKPAQM